MIFNSLEFFLYLSIVYLIYRCSSFKNQNRVLIIAGYVFYAWWDIRFAFLIAVSTTIDYNIGLMLGRGSVDVRQRATSSIFLLLAAFSFVLVNWNSFSLESHEIFSSVDWNRVVNVEDRAGICSLLFSFMLIVLLNVGYIYLKKCDINYQRKLLIISSVIANLGFLGVFKYFNFFISSAETALRAIGLDPQLFHLHILLPVGISFYTFQSLSYTIDIYRGIVKPAEKFWDFVLFVAYFPPMVAGPIERARHLLPQLTHPRSVTLVQTIDGVVLIIMGLFKKIAIADGVAPSVNAIFNTSGTVSWTDICLASILFAVQIYCDFSGYSDIARGVSKLLGIELGTNFNLPYFSRNPSEFWRRWHISLSSWLRDYLYIPLGGSKYKEYRTHINLMLTMILGGLWHGAAWNYIIWGFYQGGLLCTYRLWSSNAPSQNKLPYMSYKFSNAGKLYNHRFDYLRYATHCLSVSFGIGAFLILTCYGWLLFRSTSLYQIVDMTGVLLGISPSAPLSIMPRPVLSALLGVGLLAILELSDYLNGGSRADLFRQCPAPLRGLVYASMIVILIMGMSNAPAQFIYFQF